MGRWPDPAGRAPTDHRDCLRARCTGRRRPDGLEELASVLSTEDYFERGMHALTAIAEQGGLRSCSMSSTELMDCGAEVAQAAGASSACSGPSIRRARTRWTARAPRPGTRDPLPGAARHHPQDGRNSPSSTTKTKSPSPWRSSETSAGNAPAGDGAKPRLRILEGLEPAVMLLENPTSIGRRRRPLRTRRHRPVPAALSPPPDRWPLVVVDLGSNGTYVNAERILERRLLGAKSCRRAACASRSNWQRRMDEGGPHHLLRREATRRPSNPCCSSVHPSPGQAAARSRDRRHSLFILSGRFGLLERTRRFPATTTPCTPPRWPSCGHAWPSGCAAEASGNCRSTCSRRPRRAGRPTTRSSSERPKPRASASTGSGWGLPEALCSPQHHITKPHHHGLIAVALVPDRPDREPGQSDRRGEDLQRQDLQEGLRKARPKREDEPGPGDDQGRSQEGLDPQGDPP